MILKRAFKKLAEGSLRDLPLFITRPFESGQIQALDVPNALLTLVDNSAEVATQNGKISQRQVPAFKDYLRRTFHEYQPQLEALAYRSSSQANAPITKSEIGLTGGFGVALPKLVSHMPVIGGHAMSWKDSIKSFLSPEALAPTALISTGMSATKPFQDPLFRRGERSYLKSWSEAMKGEANDFGLKELETKQKYGPIGAAPIQALHGILNPIPSLMYGYNSIKNYATGKHGEAALSRSNILIDKMLKEQGYAS